MSRPDLAGGSRERARIPDARGAVVHTLLDDAAAAAPAGTAVRDPHGVWSYARLAAFSHAFAHWLGRRGVGAGDRIVVQSPATRELVAMCYGTSRRGAIFVPLNPAMRAYHLSSVIDNAEPRLIIAADRASRQLQRLTPIPVYGCGSVWREVEAIGERRAPAGHPDAIGPDDVALLIYTSGSTAMPKAVVCPHAQVTFAASAINSVLGYRPGDVVFSALPMSFDYGLYQTLLCCLGRCELVLGGGGADLVLLDRMRKTGTTVVPVVPSLAAMIATLARRDRVEAPRVRMFTNTGAALPQSTIDALRRSFPGARVVRQFGQTECKRVSIMPPEREHDRPNSVGLPLPGTTVLILDPDGRPVPAGQTGEIVVAGPHVMRAYWRASELTERTFRRDVRTSEPRLHTGDYGRLDEAGYLYFDGRRDDMFKRNGTRVSILEIEAAAMDIPGVRAAAALPPTERRDLALCVDSDLPPQVVLRELALRLEPAKVPATCHVVADFPLTPHGKNATAKLALLVGGKET